MFPDPPEDWLKWLKDDKRLEPPTRTLYRHCTKMYLGFVANQLKEKLSSPSALDLMWYLWDYTMNKRFFAKLKLATNDSSAGNYYAAFVNGRLWMKNEGQCPTDYITILNKLDLLHEVARRKRGEYVEDARNRSTTEHGLLRIFYLRIYHSASMWRRLYLIYAKLEKSGQSITSSDLTFVNGFLSYILLGTNYMRTGNISLLESQPMEKILAQSLGEFHARFPEEDIHNSPRRLDRSKMVPAVIRIPKGTKTKKPVDIVLLRPRDIDAFLRYSRFVRRNPPCEVTTSKFFINSKGLFPCIILYILSVSKQVRSNKDASK